MIDSPAAIVAQILVNANLVLPGWANPSQQQPDDGTTYCFLSSIPDSPDQVLFIKNTPGLFFWRNQRGQSRVHPGIQLIFRALVEDVGYDLANSVADYLDQISQQTVLVNGKSYQVQSVYRVGGILSVGEEPNTKRQLFSTNARVAFKDNQVPNVG